MANIRKAKRTTVISTDPFLPRNEKEKLLIKAFLSLKNEQEMANFLRDLLTIAELEEFANRMEIVRLLARGLSYQEIAEKTSVSTTTVSRVSHWLYAGSGGYYTVIERLKKEK